MARPIRESTQTTKDFSERLSTLVEERKKEGIPQKEIAAGIGIASGTLSDWCSDNKTPTIDAIPKISKFFGVSVEWLFGLSNDRNIRPSIIDELKLSPKAADYLRYCSSEYVGKSSLISQIIENPKFESMLANISLAIDNAPIESMAGQREFEELRKVLLSQVQNKHTATGKRITDLLIGTESVVELDIIVSILAESALDSVVLKREEAKKFYIAEAQKDLQRIIEEIK